MNKGKPHMRKGKEEKASPTWMRATTLRDHEGAGTTKVRRDQLLKSSQPKQHGVGTSPRQGSSTANDYELQRRGDESLTNSLTSIS
jgi:hypothetical protein